MTFSLSGYFWNATCTELFSTEQKLFRNAVCSWLQITNFRWLARVLARPADAQGISVCDMASLQSQELEHPVEMLLVDCAVLNLSDTAHNMKW